MIGALLAEIVFDSTELGDASRRERAVEMARAEEREPIDWAAVVAASKVKGAAHVARVL